MNKPNGALSRDELMARLRSHVWPLEVEDWGTLYVRKIPGPLMMKIMRSRVGEDEGDEEAGFRFWDEYHEQVFLKGMANEDGSPFFDTLDQVQSWLDLAELEQITTVLNEIMAVSGARDDTVEALEEN